MLNVWTRTERARLEPPDLPEVDYSDFWIECYNCGHELYTGEIAFKARDGEWYCSMGCAKEWDWEELPEEEIEFWEAEKATDSRHRSMPWLRNY